MTIGAERGGGRRARRGRPAYGRWRGGTSRRPASSRCRASASRWPARPGRPGRPAATPGPGCRAGSRARRPTDPSRPSGRAPRPRCGSRAAGPAPRRCRRGPGRRAGRSGRRRPPSNSRGPALPGDEGAGLVGHRRDREHDVGGPGHVGLALLERDHEAGGLERRTERRGVGRVVGVDAADDQAAELAGRDRGDDRVGVAARLRRAARRRPRRWRRRPGPRRRRPVGHRAAGWAGSRSRPHRGRRPGAAPRPAWRRSCGRARATAVSAPGTVAIRSPTRITPVAVELDVAVVREAVEITSASAPGTAGDRGCRPSCAGRWWRTARPTRPACGARGWPCAGAGRSCRPRPRARGPTRTTELAASRSAYVAPWPAATDLGRQEVGLLGGVRPRRGSRRRWCRAPRARTCCRRRRPRRSAGRRAGHRAAPAVGEAAGRDGERLGPRRGPQLAAPHGSAGSRAGRRCAGSRTRSGPCR